MNFDYFKQVTPAMVFGTIEKNINTFSSAEKDCTSEINTACYTEQRAFSDMKGSLDLHDNTCHV